MKLPNNPTEAQILAVTGLVIKSIYTRGTVAVQTLDLDSQGRLTGIFLGDGVRFRYTIDNGILSYAPVNPKDLPSEEGISLSEDALDFARLKMAGNTKQEKKCKVGYPCGFTCISQSKVCNKALPGQAKNGAEWVKMQKEKEARGTKKSLSLNDLDLSGFADLKPAIDLNDGDVIFTPKVFPVIQVVTRVDKSQKNIYEETIVRIGKQIGLPSFTENDQLWVFHSKDSAKKAFDKIIKPAQDEISLLQALSEKSLLKLAQEVRWARKDERDAMIYDDNSRKSFEPESKENRLKRLVDLARQRSMEIPQEVLNVISSD